MPNSFMNKVIMLTSIEILHGYNTYELCFVWPLKPCILACHVVPRHPVEVGDVEDQAWTGP